MLFTFRDDGTPWEVRPTYENLLIIQASRVAGFKVNFEQVRQPDVGDPLWAISPVMANQYGAMAADESMYQACHMRVGNPSHRVVLMPPDPDKGFQNWFIRVNDQAYVEIPAFDPTLQLLSTR